MSSVSVSSQYQRAVARLPTLKPMTSFSAHCTSPDGAVAPKQPFRSGYGLSTPESQSRALQFEALDGKFSSCSPFSGRSRVFWRSSPRPEAGPRGERTGVFRAVDGSSCRDIVETCAGSSEQQLQRRELVRVISSCIVLPGLINASSAFGASAAEGEEQSPESSTTAAPPAKTLVERLLERSKANKAKYDQERLDNYYRRNYKDYFEFLKGGIQDKDKEKLTEAEKGILSWLEKNQ